MIRAYFDSSVDSSDGRTTLAGYFAPAEVWAAFETAWNEVLGDPTSQFNYLHMRNIGQTGNGTLYSLIKAVKRSKVEFIALVKNTYRVLLSRGLKGCYVHFLDKNTERFFRSRIGTPFEEIEGAAEAQTQTPRPATEAKPGERPLPFERVPLDQLRPFENAVPVFDIRAAAGGFSEFQALTRSTESGIDGLGAIDWVAIPEDFRTGPDRFLMQVVGESMNRRIPNGSWCLFRLAPAGSRAGKVVLAELRDSADPELGGRYTVKLYRSEKSTREDDEWRHDRVVLSPDSDRGGYEAIELVQEDEGRVRIVAELVAVVATEKQ